METEEYITTSLNELLSKGADERIFLNEEGLTKYGIPLIRENYVNRGSCTCSSARESDVQLMNKILERCSSKEDWINLKDELDHHLRHELAWDDAHDFELFFAPSGTDLVYFPLLFAQLLHPGKTINNLITCIEELGSGAKLSSKGQFYASYNQFGDSIKKGEAILAGQNIKTIFLNARNKNGDVKHNGSAIKKTVEENPDDLVIVNMVYGSKSGIQDNLNLIDEIKADNLQWVVDICQFRHSRDILHSLISKGAMVMITGSKFYESSPFSGAMLVPKKTYDKLLEIEDWSAVTNYNSIFSKYDTPITLRDRNPFTDQINEPALLRWACAVDSMRMFNQIEESKTGNKTALWREAIFSMLTKSESFKLMPHQEFTNKSIVSFRVLKNGKYLDASQLKELYFSIVKGNYSDNYPFDHITIGQPVSYGDRAFLRLAIGAKTTKQFVDEDQMIFETDKMIIEIIESKLADFEVSND